MKGRRIAIIVAVILTIAFGLLVVTFAVRKSDAENTVVRLYRALRDSNAAESEVLCTASAKEQIHQIEVRFGKILDFRVKDVRAKLDNLWEVDITVTRERGLTEETVANLGKGQQVAHIHAKATL